MKHRSPAKGIKPADGTKRYLSVLYRTARRTLTACVALAAASLAVWRASSSPSRAPAVYTLAVCGARG